MAIKNVGTNLQLIIEYPKLGAALPRRAFVNQVQGLEQKASIANLELFLYE